MKSATHSATVCPLATSRGVFVLPALATRRTRLAVSVYSNSAGADGPSCGAMWFSHSYKVR